MYRVESWRQPARRKAWLRWLAVAIFCVGTALHAPSIVAQEADPGVVRITSIEVIGSQRVEPETVFTYMKIQPGDVYDPGEVDASVKSLFESGLFNDVSIRREGSQLFVTVVENPVINQVAFEGNHRIDDEQLEAECYFVLVPSTDKKFIYKIPCVRSDNGEYHYIYENYSCETYKAIESDVIGLE